jgi:hypothetical protein
MRKLLHGGAAVRLQLAQNLAVDGVEGLHWDESGKMVY